MDPDLDDEAEDRTKTDSEEKPFDGDNEIYKGKGNKVSSQEKDEELMEDELIHEPPSRESMKEDDFMDRSGELGPDGVIDMETSPLAAAAVADEVSAEKKDDDDDDDSAAHKNQDVLIPQDDVKEKEGTSEEKTEPMTGEPSSSKNIFKIYKKR